MLAPVRWGLLSTATINRKLIAGARQAGGVEIIGVASRQADRARAFADEHGIPRAHGSYEALLDDPDVDAIYVSLPNGLHHEWTVRALEAGKHVLCEKPYSRHPHEVVEAFDLAARGGLVLSEAYMYRYHPQIRALRDLVRDGAIGQLRLISGSFTFLPDRPGDVRLDPALDGGALLDVGCYPVSAARLLAGEPESVAAQQVIGPTGVDVGLTALLAFAGGVLAHLDCGFEVPERSALEVVGTRGRIQVRDPWHGANPGLVLERDGAAPEHLEVAHANPYALELEAVGAAIHGDVTGVLGRDDALGQATALAAIRQEAEGGTAGVSRSRPPR